MKMDKSTIAFILILIISWINPELIYNLNKSFIGKLIILIIIIFFSSVNIILGLLTIFIYFAILDKYRYIIEGMTTEEKINIEDTIGEIKQNIETKKNSGTNQNDEMKQNIKDFEEKNKNKNKIIISTSDNSNGIDVQDIRDSIASKDSNSFPLSKNMFKSSDDVEPFNSR
jgi:hypothetical protein